MNGKVWSVPNFQDVSCIANQIGGNRNNGNTKQSDPVTRAIDNYAAAVAGELGDIIGQTLFAYDEAGHLIGEYDELGNAIAEYLWLGDRPIAMLKGSNVYYLHTDHLNTPQVVTDETQAITWQGDYTPFGDVTVADTSTVVMNLRFPGQYHDVETGLNYNYFRSYNPATGRYTQSDPIGLDGGLNSFLYGFANPVAQFDPLGLYVPYWHRMFTYMGAAKSGLSTADAQKLADLVVGADYLPGSQEPENSEMHAMCQPGMSHDQCQEAFTDYIEKNMKDCTLESLAKAIHAYQDFYAGGHRGYKTFSGLSSLPPSHLYNDAFPTEDEVIGVPIVTSNMINSYLENCNTSCE